jgi:hypothetical protein
MLVEEPASVRIAGNQHLVEKPALQNQATDPPDPGLEAPGIYGEAASSTT